MAELVLLVTADHSGAMVQESLHAVESAEMTDVEDG
jgi:hypothetical protein